MRFRRQSVCGRGSASAAQACRHQRHPGRAQYSIGGSSRAAANCRRPQEGQLEMTAVQPVTIRAVGSADKIVDPQWAILCVDDEQNIVSSLRRIFRQHSYRVLTATSGAEALGLLERESVDLVISDMRMPEMDGAQFLEQVRNRWPDTVRLLLTGYADMEATIGAINRGEIYRHIDKPWNDDDVVTTVRRGL